MSSFWRGKRVLVTGHTGFKGGWLALWLKRMGANVSGIALEPYTSPNLFTLTNIEAVIDSYICDIRNVDDFTNILRQLEPEVVFHLAAQPLVRASYRQPLSTFSSNIMGTANLLEALRDLDSIKVAVMVTTDKVYQNVGSTYPYRETDTLGGHDPYSASKAAAELVINSYRDSFLDEKGVAVASARAGNVIGGGDWSEDRLIPDAIRAWSARESLSIRSPEAVRPWQHVLEPLHGYITLAELLWSKPHLAGPYNFGPQTYQALTVRQVIECARSFWNGESDVHYGCNQDGPHEASWLALEISKARSELSVQPRWTPAEAVQRSIEWYGKQIEGVSALELCEADIDAYEKLL